MDRQRLVILGSGFAAYSLLQHIDMRVWDVSLVSPRNHFLFTPMLPATAVGTVEFRTILEPLRNRRGAWHYFAAHAWGIDFARRTVACTSLDGATVWDQPYDRLVIAVGCVSNTFGVKGATEHACFLKEVADARAIRQRLIGNLELAMLPTVSPEERDRLLHMVAVGAGPTGVRFAAELYDLLATDLPRSYPDLAPHVKVTLVEAGKHILGTYDEKLREYVSSVFYRRHIDVLTQSLVKEISAKAVHLADGRVLPCGLVLWCAGFGPTQLVATLPLEKDRAGRILVDGSLEVEGRPGVYAIGDCATPRERPLPQLAQVAEQEGRWLARRLNESGETASVPFRWQARSMGSYIGRHAAVMDSPGGGQGWTGYLAYQQWQGSIWSDLVSWRNKVLVPLDRLKTAIFGRELSRL